MFDIDGTLTESSEMDGLAFIQALNDVFGFNDVSADWGRYTHITDSGIFEEIYQLRRGCLPTREEIIRKLRGKGPGEPAHLFLQESANPVTGGKR